MIRAGCAAHHVTLQGLCTGLSRHLTGLLHEFGNNPKDLVFAGGLVTTIIDTIICYGCLFVQWKLQFFSAEELFGGPAAGLTEAFHSNLRVCPDIEDGVTFAVEARFEEQGGIPYHGWGMGVGFIPDHQLLPTLVNFGVNQVIQALELGGVVEDELAQGAAADGAIGGEDGVAEPGEEFLFDGRGLEGLVGEGVGIDDGEAVFGEEGGDEGFAGTNGADEAEDGLWIFGGHRGSIADSS